MTTGTPTSASVKTESFDLLVASTTCQSLPAYPLSVDSATGAFVNTKIVICGGDGGGSPTTSNCYTLSRNETAWKLSGNLITPRLGAASVEINSKLVIFGGYKKNTFNPLKSLMGTMELAQQAPTCPWQLHFTVL